MSQEVSVPMECIAVSKDTEKAMVLYITLDWGWMYTGAAVIESSSYDGTTQICQCLAN